MQAVLKLPGAEVKLKSLPSLVKAKLTARCANSYSANGREFFQSIISQVLVLKNYKEEPIQAISIFM